MESLLFPGLTKRGRLQTLLERAVLQQAGGRLLLPGTVATLANDDCVVADVNLPTTCIAVLCGHGDEVWGVRFSGDGRRVASWSRDGTVVVRAFAPPLPSAGWESVLGWLCMPLPRVWRDSVSVIDIVVVVEVAFNDVVGLRLVCPCASGLFWLREGSGVELGAAGGRGTGVVLRESFSGRSAAAVQSGRRGCCHNRRAASAAAWNGAGDSVVAGAGSRRRDT